MLPLRCHRVPLVNGESELSIRSRVRLRRDCGLDGVLELVESGRGR